MKLRSDFRAAVLMKNRVHHESGEQVEERFHQDQQKTNTTGTRSFLRRLLLQRSS